jgi:hypothetical protein
MPESLNKIAEQIIAAMTPEQRQGFLRSVVGGAGSSFPAPSGTLADLFQTRQPVFAPAPDRVRGFQVRLDLSGIKPPVWRRLVLPGDLTLDRLHDVIQAAMGWMDGHLHTFSTGSDPRAGSFLTRYDIEEEGEEGIDERDVRLDQVVAAKGDRLWYEYDFGDGWRHVLSVEEVLDTPPARPTVIGGRRACPPEDCGGVWGYSELAAWVRRGYDAAAVPEPFGSADEARDWLPPDWHPDHFDVGETQASLDTTLAPDVTLPDELMLIKLGLDRLGHSTLDALVKTASVLDGTMAAAPDEEQAAIAVAPFGTLLDVLGDGVRLTGAGYLPPAVVLDLGERTGAARWWIGKMNREDQTFPVHRLRSAARAVGLVSVRRGVLAPSAAARRHRGDPRALWRHIASRLPPGRTDFDRQAGWITLAVVAAGTEHDLWDDVIRHILTDIGWRTTVDGRASMLHVRNPTLDVLEILSGEAPGRRPGRDGLTAAVAAARAAIFRRADED